MEGSSAVVVGATGVGAAPAPSLSEFIATGAPCGLEFKHAFSVTDRGDVRGMIAIPACGQVLVHTRRTLTLWTVDPVGEGYTKGVTATTSSAQGFVALWYVEEDDIIVAVENHNTGCLKVYRRPDLTQVVDFELDAPADGTVCAAALHFGKALVATSDTSCTVKVWSLRPSPPQAHHGPPPPPYRVALQRSIESVAGVATALCVDESTDRLFALSVRQLHCWDMQSGLLEWVVDAQLSSVAVQLEWAAAASVVVARDLFGCVRVWGGPMVRGTPHPANAATIPPHDRVWSMQLPGSSTAGSGSGSGSGAGSGSGPDAGTGAKLPEQAVTAIMLLPGASLPPLDEDGEDGYDGGHDAMAAAADALVGALHAHELPASPFASPTGSHTQRGPASSPGGLSRTHSDAHSPGRRGSPMATSPPPPSARHHPPLAHVPPSPVRGAGGLASRFGDLRFAAAFTEQHAGVADPELSSAFPVLPPATPDAPSRDAAGSAAAAAVTTAVAAAAAPPAAQQSPASPAPVAVEPSSPSPSPSPFPSPSPSPQPLASNTLLSSLFNSAVAARHHQRGAVSVLVTSDVSRKVRVWHLTGHRDAAAQLIAESYVDVGDTDGSDDSGAGANAGVDGGNSVSDRHRTQLHRLATTHTPSFCGPRRLLLVSVAGTVCTLELHGVRQSPLTATAYERGPNPVRGVSNLLSPSCAPTGAPTAGAVGKAGTLCRVWPTQSNSVVLDVHNQRQELYVRSPVGEYICTVPLQALSEAVAGSRTMAAAAEPPVATHVSWWEGVSAVCLGWSDGRVDLVHPLTGERFKSLAPGVADNNGRREGDTGTVTAVTGTFVIPHPEHDKLHSLGPLLVGDSGLATPCLLVAAHADGALRLWQVGRARHQLLRTIRSHKGSILELLPVPPVAATTNTRGGPAKPPVAPVAPVDSRCQRFLSVGRDGEVRLWQWDVAAVSRMPGDAGAACSVMWYANTSPDVTATELMADGSLVIGCVDGTVQRWPVARDASTVQNSAPLASVSGVHAGAVVSVASPSYLATADMAWARANTGAVNGSTLTRERAARWRPSLLLTSSRDTSVVLWTVEVVPASAARGDSLPPLRRRPSASVGGTDGSGSGAGAGASSYLGSRTGALVPAYRVRMSVPVPLCYFPIPDIDAATGLVSGFVDIDPDRVDESFHNPGSQWGVCTMVGQEHIGMLQLCTELQLVRTRLPYQVQSLRGPRIRRNGWLVHGAGARSLCVPHWADHAGDGGCQARPPFRWLWEEPLPPPQQDCVFATGTRLAPSRRTWARTARQPGPPGWLGRAREKAVADGSRGAGAGVPWMVEGGVDLADDGREADELMDEQDAEARKRAPRNSQVRGWDGGDGGGSLSRASLGSLGVPAALPAPPPGGDGQHRSHGGKTVNVRMVPGSDMHASVHSTPLSSPSKPAGAADDDQEPDGGDQAGRGRRGSRPRTALPTSTFPAESMLAEATDARRRKSRSRGTSTGQAVQNRLRRLQMLADGHGTQRDGDGDGDGDGGVTSAAAQQGHPQAAAPAAAAVAATTSLSVNVPSGPGTQPSSEPQTPPHASPMRSPATLDLAEGSLSPGPSLWRTQDRHTGDGDHIPGATTLSVVDADGSVLDARSLRPHTAVEGRAMSPVLSPMVKQVRPTLRPATAPSGHRTTRVRGGGGPVDGSGAMSPIRVGGAADGGGGGDDGDDAAAAAAAALLESRALPLSRPLSLPVVPASRDLRTPKFKSGGVDPSASLASKHPTSVAWSGVQSPEREYMQAAMARTGTTRYPPPRGRFLSESAPASRRGSVSGRTSFAGRPNALMPATPLPTRLVGVPADGAPEKQPVNSYDIVRGGCVVAMAVRGCGCVWECVAVGVCSCGCMLCGCMLTCVIRLIDTQVQPTVTTADAVAKAQRRAERRARAATAPTAHNPQASGYSDTVSEASSLPLVADLPLDVPRTSQAKLRVRLSLTTRGQRRPSLGLAESGLLGATRRSLASSHGSSSGDHSPRSGGLDQRAATAEATGGIRSTPGFRLSADNSMPLLGTGVASAVPAGYVCILLVGRGVKIALVESRVLGPWLFVTPQAFGHAAAAVQAARESGGRPGRPAYRTAQGREGAAETPRDDAATRDEHHALESSRDAAAVHRVRQGRAVAACGVT